MSYTDMIYAAELTPPVKQAVNAFEASIDTAEAVFESEYFSNEAARRQAEDAYTELRTAILDLAALVGGAPSLRQVAEGLRQRQAERQEV